MGRSDYFNFEMILDATEMLLRALGYNPFEQGLVDTPKRVARFWAEFLKPDENLETSFEVEQTPNQLMVVTGIQGYSMCEHHILPFSYMAMVGYLAGERIPGLSKIPRIVLQHGRKLQLQERMTSDIADDLMKRFNLVGVGVMIKGQHLCCAMRGVKQANVRFTTTSLRGSILESPSLKAEFISHWKE